MKKQTIAIVGGGAAGMMVAATLLEREDRDGKILLFEKNKSLGAKIIISGGGRCNLTTGYSKRKDLASSYTRGWKFFDTSLKKFTPRSVKRRFESHGVACKEEDDKRIFPVSNDGKEVVGMFEDIFTGDAIDIHFKEGVDLIRKTAAGYHIDTNQGSYEVDKVVLTTGGNAYSHTGSTGDGYAFAASLGHTITPLGPSLNSFVTKQERIHALSGLSFQDATAHITIQGQRNKKSGPILITHFGISGPLTFIIASLSAFEPITSEQPFAVRLQPQADIQEQEWHDYLLYCAQASKKEILTILSSKLPRRFCEALLQEMKIQPNLPVSQLTKKQRKTLSNWLGNGIPLHLIKRRPGDEFVTAGGVNTDEVDPDTLESKISPGLYFAGEILNIDGVTGGYNLQMCWSTGRSVGKGI